MDWGAEISDSAGRDHQIATLGLIPITHDLTDWADTHQLGGALGISVLVSVFTANGGNAGVRGLTHAVSSSLTGSMVFLALGLLVVVAVIARPERLRRDLLVRSP